MNINMDLYCIPYAGASAVTVYSRWKEYLNKNIRIQPLELAGHGSRIMEPFSSSIKEVVMDLFNQMKEHISARPYAIYGHSMGTIIAYELVKKIDSEGLPMPKVLFLSGRYPPHILYENEKIHHVPDDIFLKKIMDLGGTPIEVSQSKEFRTIFLPIIRSDYKLVEEYKFNGVIHTFDCNIQFFFSNQDCYLKDKNKILEWEYYTGMEFHIHHFTGGHFFIYDHLETICSIIYKRLEKYINSYSINLKE